MARAQANEIQPVGSLLRELADGGATLVKQELRLARLELTDLGRDVGAGALLLGSGVVLALLGVLALVTGLILLTADQWLRDRYWLAALLALAITALTAIV